jgi:hypothetical protein
LITPPPPGRRDHFSPQGYLRGFVHPDRVKGDKLLWVLSVQQQEWSEQSTESIGWTRGLYDYPAGSDPDATAEEVFLRPENDFPRVRERIRHEGVTAWPRYRDQLVLFAAMLAARSPLFLEQAAASIRDSLAHLPNADELARNYAITTMRAEVPARAARWNNDLHWALRFTGDPESPVVASDQSIGMDGVVADQRVALEDAGTVLFFPLSWDMCLFGSPAKFDNECEEFLESDLRRLRTFVAKQARLFVASPVRLAQLPE